MIFFIFRCACGGKNNYMYEEVNCRIKTKTKEKTKTNNKNKQKQKQKQVLADLNLQISILQMGPFSFCAPV